MNRTVLFWCLLSATLFSGNPLMAQLTLRIDEQFFAGKKILKVETTWDGYVWVLGEDNFVARISPEDEVKDFTAFFANYSTKPFTDISSRSANTLLLGTDGDYAFWYTNGDVIHYNASIGLREAKVLSVAVEKQYYIQHGFFPGGGSARWVATSKYLYCVFDNLTIDEMDPQNGKYIPSFYRQNDRKAFTKTYYYGNTGLGSTCAGSEIGNYDLMVRFRGGSVSIVPIDFHSPRADAIKAIYASSRTADIRTSGEFSVYWAGDEGLNYLFNARNCRARSRPIPTFANKQVQTINELHLLGASTEDYLSYMLVGADDGLYVSNDNQKLRVGTGYSKVDALGDLAVYDSESMSNGLPVDAGGMLYNYPLPFCEQRLFVATSDGLFKMDYTVAPASYAHVGQQMRLNRRALEDTIVNTCGDGKDMLSINFVQDNNNTIKWQRNEQDIVGADTSFVKLTQPGIYRAVMWFGCENVEIYSKEITVMMEDAPEFTFDYPDTVDICEGSAFPLEVQNVQPEYTYRWYRNGEIITGETSAAFSVTESGIYHIGVSSCGDNFIFSDSVTVRFHRLEKPTSRDTDILVCEDQIGAITVVGYSPEVVKRWYRDGTLLTGEADTILRVSEPGAYHVELSIGSCSVMSDRLTVRIVPLPTAVIKATNEGPLCPGVSTTLTADHPDTETFLYLWSTGETTRSIEVNNPGIYTLILTNVSGCADTTDFEVTVYDPVPTPYIRDTVICVAVGEIVHIEAPAGYAAYSWNGGANSVPYFDVSAPGTYSLQVHDENGCMAFSTFEVRPYCEEVIIPNTFSPNGDGINDVWLIGGLEGGADVTVFDRNGQIVFQSRDYALPWDGLHNGRLVPVDAYYYHIVTSWGAHFKGPLTVLY